MVGKINVAILLPPWLSWTLTSSVAVIYLSGLVWTMVLCAPTQIIIEMQSTTRSRGLQSKPQKSKRRGGLSWSYLYWDILIDQCSSRARISTFHIHSPKLEQLQRGMVYEIIGSKFILFTSAHVALSPGPFPAFQCCSLKSGRAWYAKSCAWYHDMSCHEGQRSLYEADCFELQILKGRFVGILFVS